MVLDDGLMRVMVRTGAGKSTSVSMDALLFDLLAECRGGVREATEWVREAVLEVERLVQAGDPLVCVRGAGLSRQVQRLALLEVAKESPIQRKPDWRLGGAELSAGLSSVGVDNLNAEAGEGVGEGVGIE